MKEKIKTGIAVSLILQVILVKVLGANTAFIETYYSNGFYTFISKFSRTILGVIPFSIGDILYIALIFFALRYLVLKRKYIKQKPLLFIRNIAMIISLAYFFFHLLWGFNYYRVPLREKLKIEETYTKAELVAFIEELITKTNEVQLKITKDSSKIVTIPYSKKEVFQKTVDGYEQIKEQYPFLNYDSPSLKKSLYSTLLTYMGYGGYINPFTNEAQVNAKLPIFRFPVVAAHEVGHQTGYAAENETNFIGYLVTANNQDIYFKYSAYAYALSYCLSDISRQDESLFQKLYAKVNSGVQKNYKEVTDFWMAYENPMEPVFKYAFSSFLKANNQEEGIQSYSRIVALLVNYHKEVAL